MSIAIGFETGTRYVPPPPAQAWKIGPDGEQTHDLDERLTAPGIQGTDYHGDPAPVVLRTGQADRD